MPHGSVTFGQSTSWLQAARYLHHIASRPTSVLVFDGKEVPFLCRIVRRHMWGNSISAPQSHDKFYESRSFLGVRDTASRIFTSSSKYFPAIKSFAFPLNRRNTFAIYEFGRPTIYGVGGNL